MISTDETSIRVSAKSWWLHVIATPRLTLLATSHTRGRDAIEAIDVLPGYGGVIVHDGLTTYYNLDKDGSRPRGLRTRPGELVEQPVDPVG